MYKMTKHYVHKYKWSHKDRKARFKKLEQQGLVVPLFKDRTGTLYETVNCSINITRKGKVNVNNNSPN